MEFIYRLLLSVGCTVLLIVFKQFVYFNWFIALMPFWAWFGFELIRVVYKEFCLDYRM